MIVGTASAVPMPTTNRSGTTEPPRLPTKWEKFETAVGDMVKVRQWHMFRLEWNAAKGKFDKCPCFIDGGPTPMSAKNPKNWNDFHAVLNRVRELDTPLVGGPLRYAMGFRLTEDAGYFLFDLDKCRDSGQLSTMALSLIERFPGAMFEVSSTGNGMHVIGRCKHLPHSNKNEQLNIELYTAGQSIAFGIEYACGGSAQKTWDTEISGLIRDYFLPSFDPVQANPLPVMSSGLTDDEVIAKARSGSTLLRQLRGKPTFAQLFDGVTPLDSNHDMALAAILAFWTGRDEDQIERVMRKSRRMRPKWDSRRGSVTWLRYSITRACQRCKTVWGQDGRGNATSGNPKNGPILAQAVPSASNEALLPVVVTTPKDVDGVEVLVRYIASAKSEVQLINEAVAKVQETNIPVLLRGKVVDAFKAALKRFGSNVPVAQARALLFPSKPTVEGEQEIPDWARNYVFVNDGDYFFDTRTGAKKTATGFRANYNRNMPRGEFGRHGDAAEACLTTYGMTTVDHVGYKPDEQATYRWEGASYANLYNSESVPQIAPAYTQIGVNGINAFCAHLFDMCGRRQAVYESFLCWFVHNVKHPGKKIRWAPILKGINGDGKSMIFAVLRSAMGWRNVSVTGNAVLSVQSGFNDWATGAAVNIIEEIHLTGKIKYHIYNAIKEMITNDVISINPKGKVAYRTHNNTNHAATTNHNDAIPLTSDDRRWFVIATPWSSKAEMFTVCGLSQDAWKARRAAIFNAMEKVPGEFRRWFAEQVLPVDFDSDGDAPATPEKRRMLATSSDEVETIAMSIVSTGGFGVTDRVLSSHCFSSLLKARCAFDGVDAPKTSSLNHLLSRLGYQKLGGQVKWLNRSHTVWVKDGPDLETDAVRAALDATALIHAGPILPASQV